ncbi:hypothetical protein [Anaerotignum sp. MB30-C6]|uniref:hypothetical protein n=1 Tax=Anaerotignum sp. MB30-C6 TaxID=3070814 RepID=UPI0027DDF34A|nr:hypothetical protein [Anaerotignum sp. MB30-C6]WMI80502.1 hypothetical protein RBQ60_11780 [Anaerotignum sp. MB30-C6]
MSAFLNLGSLVLGVVSWIIPIVAVKQYGKRHKVTYFSVYSFTACTMALVFQLFEIRHRVNTGDFSAIMDTIGAITVVSVILIMVTVVLNSTALYLCSTKNK